MLVRLLKPITIVREGITYHFQPGDVVESGQWEIPEKYFKESLVTKKEKKDGIQPES